VTAAVAPPKPRLRGWLHLVTTPLALVGGLILTAKGTTYANRLAVAVFTATACLMFGTSAMYHLGTWPPRVVRVLRRLDLANIALIIAGTYTPIAVAILPRDEAEVLLWIVWIAAIAITVSSVGGSLLQVTAPRWLYTGMYIVLGWAAVFWFPELWHYGGIVNFALILLGGVLYTAGGVVYALKRPDPAPQTFGFHEIFHACTVAAFACHFVVVARVAC
jgi:hemolysin III